MIQQNSESGRWRTIGKILFDYGLTVLFIIPAVLVMLIIAIAIKLDSRGPVFFRQRRQGLNNSEFTIIKFRTMSGTANSNPYETGQVALDNGRVTRVGRFLRLTGLDELPQLFNVVKGDMSLVGPRPHLKVLDEKYNTRVNGYNRRHNMKPGITGWAQVNGSRGDADSLSKMDVRIQYDLFYIDNWSMLLDFRIILMTIFLFLRTLIKVPEQHT